MLFQVELNGAHFQKRLSMKYICRNICRKCGLIIDHKEKRCPTCFGPLRDIPQYVSLLPTPILSPGELLSSARNKIEENIQGAQENLQIGNEHIKNNHYDSAANSFRISMEYILTAWLYIVDGNYQNSTLRGWLYAKNDIRHKALDDITYGTKDEIEYLNDIGVIDCTSYI